MWISEYVSEFFVMNMCIDRVDICFLQVLFDLNMSYNILQLQ